ncbi:hypothetical protein TcasGA2_TC034321 [Tribolium castaneum]|uniref:Uncharacterized protein n=1 Tax=Tribolium castaneum TaxID=7070 RepID=A0A139WC57_TRICA|nr:hypothetical protein TcasGA2_TC034321 [Tribolium castaneum]
MCVSVVVLFRPEQALIVILPLIDGSKDTNIQVFKSRKT